MVGSRRLFRFRPAVEVEVTAYDGEATGGTTTTTAPGGAEGLALAQFFGGAMFVAGTASRGPDNIRRTFVTPGRTAGAACRLGGATGRSWWRPRRAR